MVPKRVPGTYRKRRTEVVKAADGKTMKIGLIDVDGHNFPNLALMRISAYHKSIGDDVEWWRGDAGYYDVVYMSKIFSDAYSPDIPEPENAGAVIKGGTGYCISLGDDGKEHFDQSKNHQLPPEIEKMFPDYSIYPQFDYAVALTSRGCPRGCAFCHVGAKEGRCSVKVADVKDFWCGQKEIKVLDPNITACAEKRDLFRQYIDTKAWIDFTQGIDIRLTTEADIEDLNRMKIKMLHFAWDNPNDDLEGKFREFSEKFRIKNYRRKSVYCLTNFEDVSVEEHMERALHRIYLLRDLGYQPYVMIYNKPEAAREIRLLQRWCNNKIAFSAIPDFKDYDPKKEHMNQRKKRQDKKTEETT